MEISAEKMLEVIEALLRGKYAQKEYEPDFSGCYNLITTPDGYKGYKAVYDDAGSGTTPPVLRGIVDVAGLKIFYTDPGSDFYDSYPTEFELVDDYYADDDDLDDVWTSDDVSIEGEERVIISNELERRLRHGEYCWEIDDYIEEAEDAEGDTEYYFINRENLGEVFKSLFVGMFCMDDTWNEVPDDLLEDEAVDIEDCHLIEDDNHGVINYDGKVYYIVDEDPVIYDKKAEEIQGKDDSVKFVYAIPETCTPNEYGKYGEVYLIGYKGELESAEVVFIREHDATYDCVEKWIN